MKLSGKFWEWGMEDGGWFIRALQAGLCLQAGVDGMGGFRPPLQRMTF